jgi:hypothetical protein
MTVLQRTLAILAFLALSAQIVRHAYILWFEPKGSVLDRYEQPLKGQITNARSLQELINQYEPIHKQAEQARLQNARLYKECSDRTVQIGNDASKCN